MLIRSALIIVAVTMVGRLLGFVRGIFISKEFGVGVETDAYFMAFVIPMTMLMVLPGAINSVFIPALNGARLQGEKEGRLLFEKVFSITILSSVLLTLLLFLISSPLISALAPGFSGDKQQLTVELLQYMLPSIILIALTGVFSSVLNVDHQFFYPSLGTVINSFIVILSIFLLVPFMGIHGLALGTTLGFAGYALIMVPSLLRKKYGLKFRRGWRKDTVLSGMGERFVPIMIGSFISQLTIYIERFFASGLGDAKVASLALAYTVMQLPMAVFVGAFTVPLFPLLSEHAQKKQWSEMKSLLEKVLSYLIIILVPVMAGLMIMSEDVIRLLYERGEFNSQDTQLTAWALLFYSLAILGLALRDTLTRAFYAMENTKTPVLIGVGSIIFYIFISLILMPVLNYGGIALATGLAAYVSSILLGIFLWKKIGSFMTARFWVTLLKSFFAAGSMVAGLWWLNGFPGQLNAGVLDGLPLIYKMPAVIMAGAIIYLSILLILKERYTCAMLAKYVKK